MRIVCATPIKDLNQKQVTHQNGEKATFQSIARDVLVVRLPSDPKDNGQVAYQMYCLAKKLSEGPTCDLTIEEAAIIKRRVAEAEPNNLVLGRMFDILEGKADHQPDLAVVAKE